MNTKKLFAPILFFALILALQVSAWADSIPTVKQTITLKPGWNAVYLEVQPQTSDLALIFPGLPTGSSIYAWTGRNDSVQFIQDPSEPPIDNPKWRAIFGNSAEPGLNNLYGISANSAYLVRTPAGSQQMTIDVTGRPTIRHKGWVPDSFNLTGFGFSSTPPTFASYFASSNSHKNQAIYRLNNTTGAWELIDPTVTGMSSGEAFWVYCQNSSDYQGPLTVEAGNADGLNFGAGIPILTLKVSNHSATDRSVSVAQLGSNKPVALAYQYFDVASGLVLTKLLTSMPAVSIKAGGSAVINLAAQRGSFSGQAASVLEFADGQGNRVRVPVTAASNPVNSYSGLWSGVASLNKVSQLTDMTGEAPDLVSGVAKPAPSELNLNLILHQDSNSQVRLLKQVVIMHQDGTRNPDGTVKTNSRNVALTNDKLIPNFKGVTQRDGAGIGRRISAVGFDYSPGINTDSGPKFADTTLRCTGSIATTVTCHLILESSQNYTHPTNPFLHRYHPDHDNLGNDFKGFQQEVNKIERDVALVFDSTPLIHPENPPTGWGVSVLGGTYTEEIRGLAKGPIKVQGNFTLKLMSDVVSLND